MVTTLSVALALLGGAPCEPVTGPYSPGVLWRTSTAIGRPWKGRLKRGVQLPGIGTNHVTLDPGRQAPPNRPWRRWGTDRLVRTTLCAIDAYRVADPAAPRVVVGDLSLPHGGSFGPKYGGLGHSSHQNGLDVDVYYPRTDGRETAPSGADEMDHDRAQALLDQFIAAGAVQIYVGPHTGLHGPGGRGIVRILRRHDDHMHVRIARRAPVAPAPGWRS